jgi:predicted adenylyl cyclase CyaB
MQRIEIEKKFYCANVDDLIKEIKLNNLEFISTIKEIDEYFTDVESEFVLNRTCLRIRTTNDKDMEITFKGKSKELSNLYLKRESNITVNIEEYNDVVTMFNALGYYSYTKVNKERITYSLIDKNITYNVMIDKLSDIGSFVEFEILSDSKNKDDLILLLNNFIDKFSYLNLDTADMPYRDFVAKHIYNSIKPKEGLKAVLFDLDGTLIESEIAFFNSFKKVLKTYNVDIDYKFYKSYEQKKNAKLIEVLKEQNKLPSNISQDEIMSKVYSSYEQEFRKVITKPTAILNFLLIKKLKAKGIKVGLVTTSRRIFVNILIDELKLDSLFDLIIAREDVLNLKPAKDAYEKALLELNINKDTCIVVEDALRGIESSLALDLKTINVGEDIVNHELVTNIDHVSRLLFIILNWI